MRSIESIYNDFPLSMREFEQFLPTKVEDERGMRMIVNTVLSYTPRILYELFDNHGLLIQIIPLSNTEFLWAIFNKEGDCIEESPDDTDYLPNRIEAEGEAFMAAFRILEDKLKQ